MKNLLILISLFFINLILNAQCTLSDDYSNSAVWTQIGTNVEVNNGKVNFLNGSANSEQRRVYRSLGDTLNSNDTWVAEFDFFPSSVGSWGGPAVGHQLFSLTAGTQEPLLNCPNIPCTGYPVGNQDAIIVNYVTDNQNIFNGPMFFRILAKDGFTEYRTPLTLISNSLNIYYYMRIERVTPTTIQLSVFSDSNRTVHLPNSPISLTIPASIDSLNTLQHANSARGDSRRQLTGTIDNLCLNYNTITSIQDNNLTRETLSVFPNPTKDILTIEGIQNTFATVQLFNTSGQLVLETSERKLSLTHLSKGVYFIRVQDGETLRNGKVIVE